MNRLSRAALLAVALIFILPTAQASFPEEPAEEWYVLDAADVLVIRLKCR